ncbi:MAG: DUF4412 domain-containing protein [Gemmatimonadaceae bacterium]
MSPRLTSRPRARRPFARAALALVLPAAVLAAALPVAPGTTYTFRSTTQTVDGKGNKKDVASMLARGQVTGTKARLDFDATNGPAMPMAERGNYMLIDGGSGMLTIVAPGDKQYTEMNMAEFGKGIAGMMSAMGGMMKMSVSDVQVSTEKVGAGETIAGHATEHYRVTNSYTMAMSMFGRKSTTAMKGTIDYWVAPDLKHLVNPFMEFGGSMAGSMASSMGAMGGGMQDLMDKMQAAQKQLFTGMPVKMVSTTVATDEKGTQSTTIATTEMSDFKSADIPASTFEVPAGYTKTELAMPGAPAAGAPASSAATPKADSAGKTEAKKEDPKDKLKKGLGGLIRRP